MASFTLLYVRGHFVLTGQAIKPMKFDTHREAQDWARKHFPGSVVKEVVRKPTPRGPNRIKSDPRGRGDKAEIRERPKAATKVAKTHGLRPRLAETLALTNAARKEAADAFADNIVPVILEIRASGVKTKTGIARALTERGVPTARGGEWCARTVYDVLRRDKTCGEKRRELRRCELGRGVYKSP